MSSGIIHEVCSKNENNHEFNHLQASANDFYMFLSTNYSPQIMSTEASFLHDS